MKFLAKLILLLTLCGAAFSQTINVNPVNLTGATVRLDQFVATSKRVVTGSDGFPRVAYLFSDAGDTEFDLLYIKCNDAACASQTESTVYHTDIVHNTSPDGCILLETQAFAFFSMSLTAGDVPRFSVMGVNNTCGGGLSDGVGYIECSDNVCSSHQFTFIIGTNYTSVSNNRNSVGIATNTSGVSTLLYVSSPASNFVLNTVQCSANSCGTPTTIATTANTNVFGLSSVHLASDQTVRFVYYVGPNSSAGALHYYSNGTDNVLTATSRSQLADMDLGSDGFANIAWAQTNAGSTVKFAHCTDAVCGATEAIQTITVPNYIIGPMPSVVVSKATTVYVHGSTIPTVGCSTNPCLQGVVVSMAETAGFARIGLPIENGSNSGWQYVACTNSSCSTNTSNKLVPPSGFFYWGDISLATNAVTADFSITATPAAQILLPGGAVSYTVTIAPLSGFTGTVSFSTSGLPTGATDTYNPATVTGGTGTTILTVATTTATAKGVYPLTVTGTSGALTHTASVSLTVLQQKPKFVSRKIIDLIGGNPQVSIPVRSKDGKIPFSYYLIESPVAFTFQNQWVIQTSMVGVSSPTLVDYAPVYLPAVPAVAQLPSYIQTITDSEIVNPSAITIGTPPGNLGWYYIDSSYTSHFFNVTGVAGAALITDGSGYTLTASGSASVLCQTAPCPTIVDTAGNTTANNNNVDPLFQGNVASFTDPAGVKLTAFFAGDPAQTVIYTDTMGYVALTAAETNAKSHPPDDPRPTNQYTYVDASGAAQRFTVLYAVFYQSTNFGCPGISEMPRTPVYLPVQVQLPDKSFYLIGYEPTPGGAGDVTGRIASVVAPNGGRTTYQYGGANNGVNCDDGSIPSLVVKTADGGVWTYTHILQ